MSQIRLFTRGTLVNFRRNLHNQDPSTVLVKIDGVNDRKDVDYYLGKRVVYVYRAKRATTGLRGKKDNVRTIWGRITRAHGGNGVVRAKFAKNIPARILGASVRVMMYPSRV
eukprot:TRINITY_DN5161_c0_g2_i1.p2 TRINITY_DN5161_c0_g2~~TRINITY_DN5161_c0_g2_i1.p2  ORF type:complete len:112 (+),score=20.64 TRINITY_DN5161_c0_g2_i1:106-441(+)